MIQLAEKLSLVQTEEGEGLLVAEFAGGEMSLVQIALEPLEFSERTRLRKLLAMAAPMAPAPPEAFPTPLPEDTSPEPPASSTSGPAKKRRRSRTASALPQPSAS